MSRFYVALGAAMTALTTSACADRQKEALDALSKFYEAPAVIHMVKPVKKSLGYGLGGEDITVSSLCGTASAHGDSPERFAFVYEADVHEDEEKAKRVLANMGPQGEIGYGTDRLNSLLATKPGTLYSGRLMGRAVELLCDKEPAFIFGDDLHRAAEGQPTFDEEINQRRLDLQNAQDRQMKIENAQTEPSGSTFRLDQ